jgi:hypothetical protein
MVASGSAEALSAAELNVYSPIVINQNSGLAALRSTLALLVLQELVSIFEKIDDEFSGRGGIFCGRTQLSAAT